MGVKDKTILKKPAYKVPLLLVSSTALLVLPFLKSELAWVSFVSLVPLFFALETMNKQHWSPKKIIAVIWLGGLVYMLCVTSWMLQINTSLWSYAQNVPLDGLIVLTWLACSLVLSLGFIFFGWIIVKGQAHKTVLRLIFVVPAAWVIGEFIRSWLNSVAFIGPEGTLGAFYNFGNLGFAAINTPFGYASRLVGLYGLSFLVVMINACLYWIMKRQLRLPIAALSCALLLTLVGYFAYKEPSAPTKHVAAIQLGMEQYVYDAQLHNLLQADKNRGSSRAEVVVLPEYASFFEQGNAQSRQSIIRELTDGQEALFVYSRQMPGPRGLGTNQIVYKTSGGTELSTQEKNFLIPTGEYLPYLHRFILKIIGHDQIISIFNANTGFAKGESAEYPVEYNSVYYGALVCSGAIAPQLYRDMAAQGAEVLINSASLGVFKDSPLYREQSESMVRFNAVANAKPFIQAARGNHSYIFDQNGRTLAHTSELGIDVIEADISPSSAKTLYTKFGEYMVFVSLVILIWFFVMQRRPVKTKPVQHKKKQRK